MKHAIVIGASTGIGKNLALKLAKEGYKVVITARDIAKLKVIEASDANTFLAVCMDVTLLNITIDKLNSLVDLFSYIDLIVYCAGIGEENIKLLFENELSTIQTNIIGFTNVATWAINQFQQQQFGHFVCISSIAGIRGSKLAPAYNASKAYQINYLEGLKQKVAQLPYNIYVTDIRPGLVDTQMAKGKGLFWVMPLNKAVNQIYWAINAKKQVKYITKRWHLIAGLLKILPRTIYNKM
ncbi:MAG: SDR family NAD(P)-dependent oxidoreductase [Chitinophagaceae bacterium]